MQVLLFADVQAQEWRSAGMQCGHTVTLMPIRAPVTGVAGDVCLVVPADQAALLTARFWLPTLPAPICLVTTAFALAQNLVQHVPVLRLLCHPSRAIGSLDDMLHMTVAMPEGIGRFGPLVELQRTVGMEEPMPIDVLVGVVALLEHCAQRRAGMVVMADDPLHTRRMLQAEAAGRELMALLVRPGGGEEWSLANQVRRVVGYVQTVIAASLSDSDVAPADDVVILAGYHWTDHLGREYHFSILAPNHAR
jgi:hypothetical protein